MAIDNRHDIKVLNRLYAATLNNADACRDVAKEGDGQTYSALEAERCALAGELEAAIVAMGGEPERSGGFMDRTRKVVSDVRHALGSGDEAKAGEVEVADAALMDRFDRALDDDAISATTRETIRRARDRARGDGGGTASVG